MSGMDARARMAATIADLSEKAGRRAAKVLTPDQEEAETDRGISEGIRRGLAALKADEPRRFYDPNQPRDPEGTPTGGRWTSGGASAGGGEDPSYASRVKKEGKKPGETDEEYNKRLEEAAAKDREANRKSREKKGEGGQPPKPGEKPKPPGENATPYERAMAKSPVSWSPDEAEAVMANAIQAVDPDGTVRWRLVGERDVTRDCGLGGIGYIAYYTPPIPRNVNRALPDGVTFNRDAMQNMAKSFGWNADQMSQFMAGTAAHEFQHAYFRVVSMRYDDQANQIAALDPTQRTSFKDTVESFRLPGGNFRPSFVVKYPDVARYYDYFDENGRFYPEMMKTDGISNYSRSYYEKSGDGWAAKGGSSGRQYTNHLHINESLSEMSVRSAAPRLYGKGSKNVSGEGEFREPSHVWQVLQSNIYTDAAAGRQKRIEEEKAKTYASGKSVYSP